MSGPAAMKTTKYKGGKTCLCRNPEECKGLTSAFVLLSDPRKGFVKLPSFKEDPPSQYYVERNQQRESYLRYLLPGHPVQQKTSTKNIALHHFHPKVTGRFLDKRQKEIPKTITEEEMAHLGMELHERDRVVDENGFPTGEYIFVPNYPVQKVKEDLKRMIMINRMLNEAAEAQKAREEYQAREHEAEQQRMAEEADREEPAEPSPLETYKEPPDAEARKVLQSKLELWEQERRDDYAVLFETTSSTWRGSIDFLENGVREIARAERLVMGAALADQAFSDAMYAMSHDSYIDEDGNVVTEGWRQNKLLGQRENEWMPTEMLGSLVEANSRLGHKFGDAANYGTSEIASEISVARQEMEVEISGIKEMGDSILREMDATEQEVLRAWYALHHMAGSDSYDSDEMPEPSKDSPEGEAKEQGEDDDGVEEEEDFVNSTGDNKEDDDDQSDGKEPAVPDQKTANQMLEDALSPSTIKTTPLPIRQMSGRAFSPTGELDSPNESDEDDTLSPMPEETTPTSRRFPFLQKMSDKMYRQTPSPGTTPLASTSPSMFNASPAAAALRKISGVKDIWVRESLYRAAVRHQAKVWHTSLGLLDKMNEVVKEIELERSVKLHAILMDFLPRERRVFLGLPAVPKHVMSKLMDERVEMAKMEDHIEETLHKRSRIVLRIDNDQRSSIMNRSRCAAPDLSQKVQRPISGEAFQTDMMRFAQVVERRIAKQVWKMTLAVVTADYYLHLFDVSAIAGVDVDTDPKEAYTKLLPNHNWSDSLGPHSDKLVTKLTPCDSVNLANVTVSTTEEDHLEVTETVPGYIREKAARKFYLKLDEDEIEKWQDVLTRTPADELPCPAYENGSSVAMRSF